MMMHMAKNMRILDVHCCDSVALIVVASNTNREISYVAGTHRTTTSNSLFVYLSIGFTFVHLTAVASC